MLGHGKVSKRFDSKQGNSSAASEAMPDRMPDFSISLATLRFRDPVIEETYQVGNFAQNVPLTRFSIAGGAFIFAIYALLDPYIIPDIVYEAWAIRLGIVCPLLMAIVAYSYTSSFSYRHQGVLGLSLALPSLGVVAMAAIAESPGNHLYYAGIIIIIGYNNCLWRLGYMHSTFMSLLVLVCYEIVVFFINPLPDYILLNNNAFLCFAIGVSVFVNYIQEYQLRKSFVDKEKLRAEQMRSERLLSRSEAANRAKNDFLAIMSHELRTPLNAIIGFSEIIANQMFGPVGQEKYADYAGDIRSSGTHLLSIINDILDISKAEAGKLSLEEEPIDPVDALNRSMHMFRQRASEIGVDLTFRVRDDIPWIIADPRLFNQVAINLTSNALKFTPEGGRVWIEIGLDHLGNFALSVKDTGIGIKHEDVKRIFEPFVQVENAMSRTHQGTGLGLPLVRKIMNLHGGTIELESTVGEGTTATATFPKSRFIAPEATGDRKWNSLG
ncbi:MAG: ATP-binding protein [Parvibaculum sp.]|nr:ATP-binding protein [Parvibaculum sp.]